MEPLIKYVISFVAILIVLNVVSHIFYLADESTKVVTQEIEPSVIQEKYVWFQNQKAAIDNSNANIVGQINAAKTKKPKDANNWTRTDKELYSRSIDDIMSNIALRNSLVRDYNSAMSQWQMRIANLGAWPQGATYSQNDFKKFPGSITEYDYGEELSFV